MNNLEHKWVIVSKGSSGPGELARVVEYIGFQWVKAPGHASHIASFVPDILDPGRIKIFAYA